MEERAPDLVRELTRLLPTQRLGEIFLRLVQERISIRDLKSIMEALIDLAPREKDTIMLVEHVRGALKADQLRARRRAESSAGDTH
jgi:type III secretion protein V